jgi:hypothetical protein
VSLIDLTYRQASPNGYRVSADGVSIGSILRRVRDGVPDVWRWGIDVMPLMDGGGLPPSGEEATFEAALDAFRDAFEAWRAALDPELWQKNRDHIAAAAERWRR